MSGRAAYSSGADAYLGANEASALVGAWRQLGSDVQISNRGFSPNPHHHHHHGRGGRWGQQTPAPQYGAPFFQRQPAYNGQYNNAGYRPPYNPGYQAPATAPPFFQSPGFQAPAGGGVTVRDHRVSGASRQAAQAVWNQRFPGVPFVGVEALMGAVASSAGAELAGPQPRAWLRDMPPPDMANRQVLPMNTGTTPVPQNSTAQITSRPQRVAFRPERVFVSASDVGGGGNAANWIINDITIGNRSQFAQSGALPGDMFSSVAIDSFVTFETAQTAMDVVMIVTYQGATEGGTPFYGSIIGTAAV